MSVKKLQFFLGKLQAAIGVKETLLAADYLHVKDGSSIEVVPTAESTSELAGKFDQAPYNLGTCNTNIKLVQYLGSSGPAVVPFVTQALQASGFDYTNTVVAVGYEKHTFVGGNNFKDFTVSNFRLPTNSVDKIIKTDSHSSMFDFKITLEPKGSSIEFDGKGCFEAQASILQSAKPAINTSVRYPEYPCLPLVADIMGLNYKATKFELAGGNKIEQTIDWANQYGFGYSENVDKLYKITTTIYAEPGKTLPLSVLQAQTLDEFSAEYGPLHRKTKISATNAQIVSVKESFIGEIAAYDLELGVIGNDLTIEINSDIIAA